jgi:hypothetical protein
MAFKGPMLEVEWQDVSKRAKLLEQQTGLPTRTWVQGLSQANARQELQLRI